MEILIYDRAAFTFKESLTLGSFEIVLDTVISGQSTFTVNDQVVSARSEDILILHERSFFYIGIIKKIETENLLTKITAVSFTAILDVEVIQDSYSGNLGDYLVSLISAALINNEDEKQNLPYVTIENTCAISDSITMSEAEVTTIEAILEDFNKFYGIRLEARLGIINGQITHIKLVIKEVEKSMKLKGDLFLLRNLSISQDSETPTNKVILYGEGLPNVCYFLLQDGEISMDASDVGRITPVKLKYVSYQTSDDLETLAKKELVKEKYAHAISFDIHLKNKIFIPFSNVRIGDQIEFVNGETTYRTIFSQIVYKGTLEECSIILGEHRIKLTEKLKLLERR